MAAAAMAGGAAIGAVGSIGQGNANGNVADYNAQIANQNAATVEAQGAEQERRSLVNSNKVLGQEGAAYGASGVGSTGSAMDVMRNSAANGELNALTIKNQADVKATAYANEAALDQFRGSNDRTAGYLNAAAGLLGAGGKIASLSSGGTPATPTDPSAAGASAGGDEYGDEVG